METHLKKGELSEYGFACGYVQRAKNLPKGDVWMYREHNTYHVRTSKEWLSFDLDELKQARLKYSDLVTQNS